MKNVKLAGVSDEIPVTATVTLTGVTIVTTVIIEKA
jgi:hypothetical protein